MPVIGCDDAENDPNNINEGLYDLHVHTTASDGIFTPEQVISKAIEINLAGMAISDHDTVEGLITAEHYLKNHEIELDFMPAIEMNTELNGYEIHILGYDIDFSNQKLNQHLQDIKEARFERARKMVKKLRNMGMMIDLARVQEIAIEDLIARPHIARALMEKRYVSSEREAFDKYIGKGRAGYVPRYKFEPETALALIKEGGGASILAHPGLIKNDKMVDIILEMGVEGLEVYYPEHNRSMISKYMELCRERNLLVTGGSDFHGNTGNTHSHELGSCGISIQLFNQLKGYINRKK
ncbi:putative metal-dependent phosphoesterase (php family) [hydrocarbon metagenome]|uniref:Putative metal-dependent phosphoesterase (Php family) n=1 Tax=hydrocarbon metagenome TaxID=938273 RepID=A0A0W8E5C5_9ZZZZ